MSAHDDLVRSLTVERFTVWTPTIKPGSGAARQLAHAIAHEKRRTKVARSTSRRRAPKGETIEPAPRTP
jgi:hypothetical protein